MAKVNEEGADEDYDVVVPTAQNQINIENDLKEYVDKNLDKGEPVRCTQPARLNVPFPRQKG